MGSPISCLLAEILMNLFEEEISFDFPQLVNMYYWHRYVDEILCTWSGSIQDLHEFLTFLNAQIPQH